ncbi:hypothetical protein AB0I95_29865 [Micromonospora sp. NPDC049751]|uniref:hypothetical protein n=1 Tax=Micromonospora sp. NPDC049751 TaxID=3154837 RepID=UPI0033C4023D
MTAFKAGDVVLIGAACSVQFSGDRVLRVRLVSIGAVDAYHGWVWLTGYVLDAKGTATGKREVYVRSTGIKACSPSSSSARCERSAVSSTGRVSGARRPTPVLPSLG